MNTEKVIGKYAKIYRKALIEANLPDPDVRVEAYKKRLEAMYASDSFRRFNIYPSTDTVHIFGVIAMCLELKEFDLSDAQIIEIINNGFSVRRNFFRRLLSCIDLQPNAYAIAEKWNISDHDKRVQDGSITYDYFNVGDGKIEYSISGCAYVRMFEAYGIRSLCKIFCMTDTTSYENLPKHVKFIRHSDLSDGDCCHDEVIKK